VLAEAPALFSTAYIVLSDVVNDKIKFSSSQAMIEEDGCRRSALLAPVRIKKQSISAVTKVGRIPQS
jgi:hypothetical protein